MHITFVSSYMSTVRKEPHMNDNGLGSRAIEGRTHEQATCESSIALYGEVAELDARSVTRLATNK